MVTVMQNTYEMQTLPEVEFYAISADLAVQSFGGFLFFFFFGFCIFKAKIPCQINE